jgi:hypothetical protein
MRSHLLAATTGRLGFLLTGLLVCLLAGATARSALQPPADWELGENLPDPFCPGIETTTIPFAAPEAAHVEIQVWNEPMTSVIKTLVDQELAVGHHQVLWDGYAEGSVNPVPPATYRYRMRAYDPEAPDPPLFEDTRSLTVYCVPTPAPRASWAQIKSLFR